MMISTRQKEVTMPSEANYSYTVKIANQHLFTIRGDNWSEFASNIDTVLDNVQLVAEKLATLAAMGAAAPVVNVDVPVPAPEPAAAPGWGTAPATPAPNAFAQAAVPSCAHGPRTPVSKVGAKGPWKAWMCNAPQGGAKCDPIWVDKKDAAAWNNFPA
jgi:hypothetical protein